MDEITPDRLQTCLEVLEELRALPPDDPTFLAVERAAAHLRKAAQKKRRLARKQQSRARDVALLTRAQAPSPEAAAPRGTLHNQRACYVCKEGYREVDPRSPALCPPCAEFNLRKREARADLRGRRALLTGGRIKIGFHTALKLLRDGAQVTITTRFPRDAATRYAGEVDFGDWKDRLEIVGLDLLDLPQVLGFCEGLLAAGRPLDVLVNNAAQTLRRPEAYYAARVAAEREPWPALLADLETPAPARPARSGALALKGSSFPLGLTDEWGEQLDLRPTNSWVQTLEEVAPVELLEVHVINAVAPGLLCGQLKPLLASSPFADRYVVNVSAMEGQLARPTKTARHPHTNMAKAALNMLTRTSAQDYATDGIFMVSVDTGWITDENPHPQREHAKATGFRTPLDVVDGAARVYDPVVRGVSGDPVHGCFLKDYRPHAW